MAKRKMRLETPAGRKVRKLNTSDETQTKLAWHSPRNCISKMPCTLRKKDMKPLLTAKHGISSLPSCIMQHIFGFLSLRQKRRSCQTSKKFFKELEKPNSYTEISIHIDCEEYDRKRIDINVWLNMINKGLMNNTRRLRIFKTNDRINDKKQLTHVIDLLSGLSSVLWNLEIFTVELGRRFLQDNDIVVNLCNKILINNAENLTMLLWHTDTNTKYWPFPLFASNSRDSTIIKFPSIVHLNFAGDFNLQTSLIRRCPQLSHLKLTCTAADSTLAVMEARKLPLSELRIRPVFHGRKLEEVVYMDTAINEQMDIIEIDLSKCAGTCEAQLLHVADIPDFNMYKISSHEFTDKLLNQLGARGKTHGLFLGKNSITAEALLKFVDASPELKWLRLVTENGPMLTEAQQEYIKTRRPGINFWMRLKNATELQERADLETVYVWKNEG